jgi:hypothetical protein
MDIQNLRKLHQPIMDHLLYFANDDSPERRRFYEDLFVEVWDHIPELDRKEILKNLEFILCKRVVDLWNKDTPACALLNKISLRSFIVFDPFSNFIEHETKVHILAHEFAHIFYNHPLNGSLKSNSVDEEKKYIEEEAEPQAYELTEIWGFPPHPDDIHQLLGYKKFVLKEK